MRCEGLPLPIAVKLVPLYFAAFCLLRGKTSVLREFEPQLRNDYWQKDPPPPMKLQRLHDADNSTVSKNESASFINDTSLVVESVNGTQKSYFILHVGPPKTATTTLQLALKSFANILQERDNVLYFSPGNVSVPLVERLHSSNCHVKLKQVREEHEAKNSSQAQLRNALASVKCWKPFLDSIQSFRQNYTDTVSFMYSAEGFGIAWARPTDWISLRETLASLNIELVVVITYRRYYEWLLSSKQHTEKWTGAKKFITEWPEKGGRITEPFLPLSLNLPFGKLGSVWFPFLYTDAMVAMIAPHVPQTKILNLHEEKSVLSTYLCDVLPNAPETCLYSLEKDASRSDEFRANTQGSFREKSKGMMQTVTSYDRIIMEAAKEGLINTTLIKRRTAGLECRDFHQLVLNKTETDLQVICPSQKLVNAMLNESLAKERAVVPDFYEKHRDAHLTSFWKAAAEKKFCVVNAALYLRIPIWRKFLQSLGRPAPSTKRR